MDPKKLNIVLGISTVVLLAVIAYLLFGQNPSSELSTVQNSSGTKTDTSSNANTPSGMTEKPVTPSDASVKTYSNTKYGFSFQYPKEWEIHTSAGGAVPGSKDGIIVYAGTKENIAGKKNPGEGTEGAPSMFAVFAHEIAKPEPALVDCKNYLEDGLKFVPYTISNIKTNKCTAPSMFGMWMSINFTPNNSVYYRLTSDNYEDANKSQVDKILSTFKFSK